MAEYGGINDNILLYQRAGFDRLFAFKGVSSALLTIKDKYFFMPYQIRLQLLKHNKWIYQAFHVLTVHIIFGRLVNIICFCSALTLVSVFDSNPVQVPLTLFNKLLAF